MSKSVHSVKLIPYDSVDLDRLSYTNGDIVYDVTNGTLRLMDGVTQGGTKIASQPYVTSALAAYATNSALSTAISTEVTNRNTAITSALAAYEPTTAVNTAISTALSSYTTTTGMNTAISTALSSYTTTTGMNTAITTALSSYVTSSSLSTTLAGYATTTSDNLKAPKASPTFTGTVTAPVVIVGGTNIKAFAMAMGASLA